MKAFLKGDEIKDEKITQVKCYSTNFITHYFIVFKANQKWCSIEKNDKSITMQDNKEERVVIDKFKQKNREKTIDEMWKVGVCDKTVHDLLTWIHETEQISKSYNVFTKNCKHFARDVYKYLTNT